MNEFSAKKLAEVEAFVKLSGEIIERAGQPLVDENAEVVNLLSGISTRTFAGDIDENMQQVFTDKVAKTMDKLRSMMELYIGSEWDNPVEVLEWTSFFSGAGAAHAALASELGTSLHQEIDATRDDFEKTLQQVITSLRSVAAKRAH